MTSDFSPQPSLARIAPGIRLNGIYEVESLIGSGGMGDVYKGRTIHTGDIVAIKVLRPEFGENEAALGLFRKEASALHNLHHEAIIRYYVCSVDPELQRPYLAMEFVEGQSLSQLLKREPLTFEAVRNLARRVASGLHAAHERGIVHRDVAPDNIIIPGGDVGRAKIIDFGIARFTQTNEGTIIGGGFAGKYKYVSPEQLGLFGGDVTAKSDIYSLGLVLVEALTGQAIDMGGSQAQVVEKRRKLPDLGGLDLRIRPLLEQMLQPDPADRPESMLAIADWANNISTAPSRPRTTAHAHPGVAQSRGWMFATAAAALLTVVAGGGIGYYLYQLQNARPSQQAGAPPASPAGNIAAATPPALSTPGLTPAPPSSPAPAADTRPTLPPPTLATPVPGTPPSAPALQPNTAIAAAPPSLRPPEPARPAETRPSASAPPTLTPSTPSLSSPSVVAPPTAAPVQPNSAVAAAPPSLRPPEPARPTESRPSASAPPALTPAPPALTPAPPPALTSPAAPSPPNPAIALAPPSAPGAASPQTRVSRIDSITRYIAEYEGGDCFFIMPISVGEAAARIEGYGASIAPFQVLDDTFKRANGFEPDIGVRQVTVPQCPAITFLNRVRAQRANAPQLEISETNLRSGQVLNGNIDGYGNRHVELLLVSDDGTVHNLSRLMRSTGDGKTFNLRLQLSGSTGAQPQMLVAVASAQPLSALQFTQPTDAAQAFPAALAEVARASQTLSASARYFKLQ